MAIKYVPEKEFDNTIAQGLWIADFYTDHCGPCKMLDIVLHQIVSDNPLVNIARCNIEDSPEYARRFDIMGTPTLIFFMDGVRKQSFMGGKPREEIEQIIGECMYD